MKKFFALFMAILLISLCGCAKKTEKKKETEKTESKASPTSKVSFEWQSHPGDFKLVAFTFDDAPASVQKGNNETTTIIETLNKYEGAGTLFAIGDKIEKNGVKLLQYAVEQGFEIGNHSTKHETFIGVPRIKIQEDLETTNRKIENRVGTKVRWFRPPFLDVDENIIKVAKELNMPIICGSRNCILQDGTINPEHDDEHIKKVCLENIYDGQIVVMHSFNPYTAKALPEICETLYNDNYRFVTLSQLFEYKGVKDVPTDVAIFDSTCK